MNRTHPHGQVTRWRGPIPAAAAVRRIDFLSKGHTIGQVVVFLPLGNRLVSWLTSQVELGGHRQIGFARDGRTRRRRTDVTD